MTSNIDFPALQRELELRLAYGALLMARADLREADEEGAPREALHARVAECQRVYDALCQEEPE